MLFLLFGEMSFGTSWIVPSMVMDEALEKLCLLLILHRGVIVFPDQRDPLLGLVVDNFERFGPVMKGDPGL